MDYSTVLSSASKLKQKSLYKVTIAEYTKELLYQINSNILAAHDAGLTKISYKLPINFKEMDNSVTNEELQTAIYYNLIKELETKDYDVSLRFSKEYTILYVSWAVKIAISDIEKMKTKILSLRKK